MVIPLALLTLAVWITYSYTLKCSFVIDDQDSYSNYSGELTEKRYGNFAKSIRYFLSGGNFPSRWKYDNGKDIPQGRIPRNHHALSIVVFNLAIIATYLALSPIVGEKLAFLALLLYVVHPLSTQAVAWVSGIGYTLSLLWMSLSIILVQSFNHFSKSLELTIPTIILFCAFQFLMIHALYATVVFPVILWFLGYKTFAIVSLIVISAVCASEALYAFKVRKKSFTEQNMGESTRFTLRKIITAFQTFGYYCVVSAAPMKLGLYHVWGYHYSKELERMNKKFLIGVVMSIILLTGFILLPFPVKLGILLFVGTMFIFLNWVTMQQFIAERYLFLPILGTCLIFSYYLQNLLPIYGLVLGLYLMRTWCHLPTYDNELKYYQSNIWNFPQSEVAYGNLGCVYLRMGKAHSAMDAWEIARTINTEYDVPNYNLFSNYKANALQQLANGNLAGAIELLKICRPYLDRAVSSPMCHFKKIWGEELAQVDGWIAQPYSLLDLEKRRLNECIQSCEATMKTSTNKDELARAINLSTDCKAKITQIDKVLENQKCQSQECVSQAGTDSSEVISKSFTPTQTVSTLQTDKTSAMNSQT